MRMGLRLCEKHCESQPAPFFVSGNLLALRFSLNSVLRADKNRHEKEREREQPGECEVRRNSFFNDSILWNCGRAKSPANFRTKPNVQRWGCVQRRGPQ